jgi:hypothetical protein
MPSLDTTPHLVLAGRAGVMWLDPKPDPEPAPAPAAPPKGDAPARRRRPSLVTFLRGLAVPVAIVLALLLVHIP